MRDYEKGMLIFLSPIIIILFCMISYILITTIGDSVTAMEKGYEDNIWFQIFKYYIGFTASMSIYCLIILAIVNCLGLN